MRVPITALVVLLALLLVPATAASPEHEKPTERYGAYAGDPRIIADAGACHNATRDKEGTACSVLYGHIFDLLNRVPINVQRVPDDRSDLARGFQSTVGYEPLWDLNHLTLWSTPGFVEYTDPNKDPYLHPERGITADVLLDPEVPMLGYWYLSADYDEVMTNDPTTEGPDVGVLPCLTVRMTLETGRTVGQGTLLAAGERTKTLVSARAAGDGLGPDAATMPCPGGEGEIAGPEAVAEFEVLLEPVVDHLLIPAAEGFILHVEWYQFAPGEPRDPNKAYMTQWNLHTGPDHLNRVVLPTKTNVWIEEVRAIAFDDKLYVQGVANSPWGSYDIDPASLGLRLVDDTGAEVPLNHVAEPTLRYSTDHGGHFLPMRATFAWDYQKEFLPPGTYTIQMEARNWQHLASATGATTIVIQEEGRDPIVDPTASSAPGAEEKAPAPVLLPFVALAGLAVALMRRRPV